MQSPLRVRTLSRLVVLGLAVATFGACAGEDGQDGPAILVQERDADDECEHGGTVVATGFDTDGDGELSDEEIEQEYAICDGPDGDVGEDGEDGEDGDTRSLVETEIVEPGEECTFGGQRVISGIDEDGSGELSEDEVADEHYMCNESCTGEMALDVDLSAMPVTVYNGFSHSVDITTDANDLVVAAYSADYLGGDSISGEAPLFEGTYDAESGEFEFSVDYGDEDGEEFVLIISDGCQTSVQTVEFSSILDGEATVYLAHTSPDAGDDIELTLEGSDDVLASLDSYGASDAVTFDWDADYAFDVHIDDAVESTGDLSFDTPWATKTIYVYSDSGDISVGVREADNANLAAGDVRYSAIHLADGVGDLDVARLSGDDTTIDYTDLSFGDASDTIEFEADPAAYFGFDTDGDGEADVEYSQLESQFDDDAVIDGFVINDDDVYFLLAINYTTGESMVADPRLMYFPATPDAVLPSGGIVSDTISVDGCGDDVVSITMDIDVTHDWRGDLIVYLENPDGDEYALKSRYGGSENDIVGNFNETLGANSGFSGGPVEPISIFEDGAADGDWTLSVEDDLGFEDDGNLNFWALNLVCE